MLQDLTEVEATEVIGAARYERTDDRVTERNGHRPRLLATQAGDIELGIPKLRRGSFFPSILEHRRRIDGGLYAVVMEAFCSGVKLRYFFSLVPLLEDQSDQHPQSPQAQATVNARSGSA